MPTGANGAAIPDSENGNYELFCQFADLLQNEEEDRAFDYQLAQNEYMAKWRFLVRHLGVTEDEAKQYVQEAIDEKNEKLRQTEESGLFGE